MKGISGIVAVSLAMATSSMPRAGYTVIRQDAYI